MPRTKPDHLNLCHHDGCGEPAQWHATLILRGSVLKGATTVRVCDKHMEAAEDFVLNDENLGRLVSHLVMEGFCDRLLAEGMVRHNAAVEFNKLM